MQVQPYLFFDGRTEEALEFYRGALGAEVTFLMHFKESPEKPHIPPGAADKVMHASFRIGDTTVMASDGECRGQPSFQGFSLSLTASGEAEAEEDVPLAVGVAQRAVPVVAARPSRGLGQVEQALAREWRLHRSRHRSSQVRLPRHLPGRARHPRSRASERDLCACERGQS